MTDARSGESTVFFQGPLLLSQIVFISLEMTARLMEAVAIASSSNAFYSQPDFSSVTVIANDE